MRLLCESGCPTAEYRDHEQRGAFKRHAHERHAYARPATGQIAAAGLLARCADRHRRRRSWRPDGPGSAARRRAGRGLGRARRRRGRSRQSGRPAQSLDRAGGWLSPSRPGRGMEPAADGRGRGGAACGPHADRARRRPLPRHRFDHRRRAALPRHRQAIARALARRACRFQHARGHAVGQHPRHAGRLPVRHRSRSPDPPRRRRARDHAGADPPDRHPFGRPGREAADPAARPGRVRHALHRRGRHEADDGGGAATASTTTRTCTSASTSTSSIRASRPASAPRCPAARTTARRSW